MILQTPCLFFWQENKLKYMHIVSVVILPYNYRPAKKTLICSTEFGKFLQIINILHTQNYSKFNPSIPLSMWMYTFKYPLPVRIRAIHIVIRVNGALALTCKPKLMLVVYQWSRPGHECRAVALPRAQICHIQFRCAMIACFIFNN